nr:MAG TPA: Transcription initiation factor IIE, alpha FINGER, Transcription [Caudoviricetes sp.]
MIDLIDRERLLNSRVYSTRSGKPNYEKMFKNLVNDILTAPTVDTERHAHWIVVGGDLGYVDCKCSACGYTVCFYDINDESELYRHCPDCGCKMDEVEDETQNN